MRREFCPRTGKRWLAGFILALVMCSAVGWPACAQQCASAPTCRETAPDGALLHDQNSSGIRVWTVPCATQGGAVSNTSKKHLDQICHQISICTAAGGFGKFLQAVTSDCQEKHFDGYFCLDGMTFGILDWTSGNLPPLLRVYESRSKDKYAELIGKSGLKVEKGCVSTTDVCERNKRAKLMCDADFHDAFSSAIKTADFQKAELEYALKQYEARVSQYAYLGLKTEYGNTAMAVVANNLTGREACHPETWKKTCAGQPDETKLVRCMLDQYVANNCRGTKRASEERRNAINAVFEGATTSENIHPSADSVIACSDSWGALSH